MKLAAFGKKHDYRDPYCPANGKSQDEKGIDLMPLDPHSHLLLTLSSFVFKLIARAISIFFFRRNESVGWLA